MLNMSAVPHFTKTKIFLLVSLLFVAAGFLAECMTLVQIASLLYIVAASTGLIFVAPLVWISLTQKHTLDMNCLMGIAVLGALSMGAAKVFAGVLDVDIFRDAAIVIFLDQIGEWLEDWSRDRSQTLLKELESLTPTAAHVKDKAGHVRDVHIADVAIQTEIVVRPGERIPLDGVVCSGTTDVNESSITGESLLATKTSGSAVYAGSLNMQGVITVRVTRVCGETVLDGIIKDISAAEQHRAPYEAFVSRFAKFYTPCVIAAALCIGTAGPVISMLCGYDPQWSAWVLRALTMLVIACPCALVISTPVVFVSAISKAAKLGILVKGGAAFDIATKIQAVVFDKTGTLTKGEPHVAHILPCASHTTEEVLGIAAALEANSTHPLARAVLAATKHNQPNACVATQIEEVPGFGVQGEIDGICVSVFKPERIDASAEVKRLFGLGMTVLVVSADSEVIGYIGCSDTLRKEAKEAIAELRALGLESIVLSGDNQRSVEHIAHKLGISQAQGSLMPAQKMARIVEMQEKGARVCMVGDGINDGPALAAANLSVTLGHGASDTALALSSVALLGSNLLQLVRFFTLSRKTMRLARENIAFALVIKGAVLLLSAFGMAGMGAAIFADTGVMLLVVLNGLRLML